MSKQRSVAAKHSLILGVAWLLACSAEATSEPIRRGSGSAGSGDASGATGVGGDAAGTTGLAGSAGTSDGSGGTFAGGGTPGTGGAVSTGGTVSNGGTVANAGSSAGGSSGSGGTTTMAVCPTPAVATAGVFNDLEGVDASGNEFQNDISSGWYLYGDTKSGTVTPAFTTPKDGIKAGNGGMVFEVTGASMAADYWGVGAGMWLTPCLDASALTGLTFWVKSDAAVKIELANPGTTSTTYGGECTAVSCTANGTTTPANASGSVVQLPFTSFTGGTTTFDASKLHGIVFTVSAPGGAPWNFDVALDDIGFY